nr:ribonuclease H-like domain-containing protein [Tanacetum cinerariifolium]
KEHDNKHMAYWLSTTSTLLYLLQKSLTPVGHKPPPPSILARMGLRKSSLCDLVRQVEAKYPALLFRQQLTAYVEKIYQIIRNNLKKDLLSILQYCIQAARKEGPAPSSHWGLVIQCLSDMLAILKDYHVPPILIQKIFIEAYSYINVQLFNSFLLHKECCTYKVGEYYVGSATDELQHTRQAVRFLIKQQKSKIGYDELTTKLCPVLGVHQHYKLCTLYTDDHDTGSGRVRNGLRINQVRPRTSESRRLTIPGTGDLYPVTAPSHIPHAFLLGKRVRLSFVSSSIVISCCFDIIHSDVWTSPIMSLSASFESLLPQIIRSLHQDFAMTDLGPLNYFLSILVTRDSLRHVTDTTYLLLYVDDIVFTASFESLLQQIIRSLHPEFAMTDLSPLNYFLGISVTRDSSRLFLSQKKYAIEILDMAHMDNCNPSGAPIDTESKLGSDGNSVSNPTLYRSLVGSLQYLTFTRPDISYAVQQVCLHMHDPREPHFLALKRILRYTHGTLDYGFQLFSSSTTDLVAYSDVDWAGCPTTRRSTSGYCVFLGNNPLSWSYKRQLALSRSSAKAEYRVVVNAVTETCWLRNLQRELHTPLSSAILVYCDNINVVYLSRNPVQHQHTKHIEIDIHFIRDLVTGQVRVLHVPSRYQFADIFIKGLPSTLFKKFCSTLSVRCPPAPTAEEC